MRRTKFLVAFSMVMFAMFGLLGLLAPQRVFEMIHIEGKDVTAFNEIRAMYGGIQLAVAAFLLACLRNRWSLGAGLFLVAAMLTGAAFSRALSLALDGVPSATFLGIWASEIVLAGLCFAAMSQEDRSGTPS